MKVRPVIFCFSGQGAQYRHMARDLLAQDRVFRAWMEEGDALVRDGFGFSVLDEIYDPDAPPAAPFDRLEATHPALFMVQYAAAKAMMARGLQPDLMLGVSLGEFVAMALAGVIGFEEALTRIARQPALLHETCIRGGLISVLAGDALWRDDDVLAQISQLAGTGSGQNCVLAATDEAIPRVLARLAEREITAAALPVPYGFHSSLIDPAAPACRAMFAEITPRDAAIPCLSACFGEVLDPATPDLLWRIVRDRMNVMQVCRSPLLSEGADYIDLSPSGALAALIRQNTAPGPGRRIAITLSPMGGNAGRFDSVARRFARAP
ncbi:MAG: acyltransferase domain-containing protein [Salinarimonas sp.]|nr:acyltransferase domain-containing protein [Salinarimonas sp.]